MSQETNNKEVVAVVAGEEITQEEFNLFLQAVPREQQAYASNPQFRAQCQEQLEALYSFAKYGEDLKLDETEEYKSVMENARKDILARLAMKQLFDSVKVTDEEVKDYYEANKSQFKKGATVHAKHILTDSEEKCNQILESIVSGEKVFEDAAKEFDTLLDNYQEKSKRECAFAYYVGKQQAYESSVTQRQS